MSTTQENIAQHAIEAVDLALDGTEGPVFGPLSFATPATGLTVLCGPGGSGRTTLALTLAGRMKDVRGELSVLGEKRPAAIRKRVGLAGVEQIDTLDRDVTVKAIFSEHRNWSRAWWKTPARATESYYEQLCGRVFGARELPPFDARISQLSALDRILLRVCLALHPAHHTPVGLLVLDDLEQVREQHDRTELLRILADISADIPVVVTAVNPLPAAANIPHRLIELDTAHPQEKMA